MDIAPQHGEEGERMSTPHEPTAELTTVGDEAPPTTVGDENAAPQILTLLGGDTAGPACTDGHCSI